VKSRGTPVLGHVRDAHPTSACTVLQDLRTNLGPRTVTLRSSTALHATPSSSHTSTILISALPVGDDQRPSKRPQRFQGYPLAVRRFRNRRSQVQVLPRAPGKQGAGTAAPRRSLRSNAGNSLPMPHALRAHRVCRVHRSAGQQQHPQRSRSQTIPSRSVSSRRFSVYTRGATIGRPTRLLSRVCWKRSARTGLEDTPLG